MGYHSAEYVCTNEIGAWIGRSGAWIRLLRLGGTPCPVPLPEPDMYTTQGRREGDRIALWRRDRLPEFEDWFRAHVLALAGAEIAAMEANVRRVKRQQAS